MFFYILCVSLKYFQRRKRIDPSWLVFKRVSTDENFYASAAQNFLMPFCKGVDSSYKAAWHHKEIADRLEEAVVRLEQGISTNLIFEMPPRHGKSETISIKFPPWVLGKHPDWSIILTSYSADLAEDFGLKARSIMDSENYQSFFETRLNPDSKARGRWLTQKPGKTDEDGERTYEDARGTYTAVGIGGAITGRGFKVGIIDDPFKNRQEADSEVIREKVWAWYKSTFRTRQEGAAIKIVVMTRWHMDDLVGRLLKKQEEDIAAGEKDLDLWTVVRFPAIAEKDEDNRKKGEALWSWKFPLNMLLKTKNDLGAYDFEALYQQNPIPSERQEFKEAFFTYFDNSEILELKAKRNDWITATLVDLAIGEKNKDDETVIHTVGKFLGLPEWYILETTSGHLNPGEAIDEIFRHAKLYRSHVAVEAVQYQKALIFFITERQRKDQFFFNVYPLMKNQSTAKEIRIRGLIPLYRAHVIKHRPKDHKKLEKQLLAFPQGDHDDHPDALANALEVFSGTLFELDQSKAKDIPPPRISDMQGSLPVGTDLDTEQEDILDGVKVGTMGRRKRDEE